MTRSAATAVRATESVASSPRVFAVGPQVGCIIPISETTQGLSQHQRLIGNFDNANRPDGWKRMGHIRTLASTGNAERSFTAHEVDVERRPNKPWRVQSRQDIASIIIAR